MTNPHSKLTEEALRPYKGRHVLIRHMFYRNVFFSDGLRYVAEVADLFWLIDFIATWINNEHFQELATRDTRISSIHFWRFEHHDEKSFVLKGFTDDPQKPFTQLSSATIGQPLPCFDIWAEHDGEDWALYLAPDDQISEAEGETA